MGLLSAQSIPLRWKDAKKYSDHVRTLGLNQFLEIYHKQKDLQKQPFVWGDEIEYIIVNIDKEKQKTKLSLRANEILPSLQKSESDYSNGLSNQIPEALWRPEGGSFMIEGTPGTPYGNTLKDLLKVESNMKNRRNLLKKACHVGDIPVTLVHYPRFGCPNELIPHYDPIGQSTQSIFLPDEVFYPHVRFLTLPENTRCRRGSKVEINVPIYHDKNTPKPFIDPTIPWDRDLFIHDKETKEAAKPDHIYMDATGFGVGCCCLQVTFQACDINEARYLYDQLAPVAPIMLALTSATPIFRGYLADADARWNIIVGSADDRTKEERGLEPLKNDRFIIPKSRYDSISTYISNDKLYKPKYNDLDLVYDKNIYQTLLDNDVDDLLAKHVSHLFIRDPLIIFEELLGQDYHNSSEHFEVSIRK
ncbi:glutamate-cysteine ligase-domain-containing protein [Cunninghamella echinulata]|nr:glutamate-cysteine ligase-domain-containing protein [Cunninghamella echinulata]